MRNEVARLSFEVTGPEDAPVLMFCHALGGDRSMWDSQVEALSSAYRILRYDLRGHGRSAIFEGDFSLEDLASDALNVLDHYGISRMHFCGLSLGGMVGQWLGIHAQDRLQSLTIVDSAPQMGTLETWNQRIQQIERAGMSSIADATMSRWFTEDFRKREPHIVDHFKSILEATSPAGYIACAQVVRDASVSGGDLERFRSVRVPTLVVTGKFDAAATPAACEAMASHIAGSRFQELMAAHISPVEASATLSAALSDFLEQATEQRRASTT